MPYTEDKQKALEALTKDPRFKEMDQNERAVEIWGILGSGEYPANNADLDKLIFSVPLPGSSLKMSGPFLANKKVEEDKADFSFLDKVKKQPFMKSFGDFAAGAAPLAYTLGPAAATPLGAFAVGAAGTLNTVSNAGEPFLSPQNLINMVSPGLSKGTAAITKLPWVKKAASMAPGTVGGLLSGGEALVANEAQRGLERVIPGSRQSPLSDTESRFMAGGLGGGAGAMGGRLAANAKLSPSFFANLLKRYMGDVSGGMSHNLPGQQAELGQIQEWAQQQAPGINLLGEIQKLERGRSANLQLLPHLRQQYADSMKAVRELRRKVKDTADKKVNIALDTDTAVTELAGDITEHKKNIETIRLQRRIDRILETEVPPEELVNMETAMTQARNEALDAAQAIRQKQEVAKAARIIKTDSEAEAVEKLKAAQNEMSAQRTRYRNLVSTLEGMEGRDITPLKTELDSLISTTGLDPRLLTPEAREFVVKLSATSPEEVIDVILKNPNAHTRQTLTQFSKIVGTTPQRLNAIRGSFLDRLINPVVDAPLNTLRYKADKTVDVLTTLKQVGPQAVNEFLGSPQAYKNLENYMTYLKKAQESFPQSFKTGMALSAGSGAVSFGMIHYAMNNPWVAGAASAAAIPVYYHFQKPRFIDGLVRSSKTFSTLLEALAKNPQLMTPGTNVYRFVNSYMSALADRVTTVDAQGRIVEIPKDQAGSGAVYGLGPNSPELPQVSAAPR